MVLPHPRGPVNVNVRKARGVSSARVPRHVGLASPMCVLRVHEQRARAGPPHTAASVAVGIAAHCLQARSVGPGTTRRATIVGVSTLSLRASWGPFVLFAVVRKDSPLHTAIDALQPEPQSGPGSSIDDQMLGY